MDDAKQFFRDKNCSFTPNGRPAKKPKKLIIKQEENPSARYITFTRPKPAHCISLQQCIESRPPMRTELLQTPSPCTYNVHCSSSLLSSNKSHLCWIAPPNQIMMAPKNTQYNIGRNNVWTYGGKSKTDNRPDPCSYTLPQLLGHQSITKRNYPSFTMRPKTTCFINPKCEARPAPNSYNIAMANNCVFTSYPSHSFQSSISHKKKRITTPGPAHYHLKI